METKKLTKDIYKLVSYSYMPLIDSMGICCDNCGRLISNIAKIENSAGKLFMVGLDCAKTILGKKDYEQAKQGINGSKKAHEKIKQLEAAGKTYVLNAAGWPCFPPETRGGFMIKY